MSNRLHKFSEPLQHQRPQGLRTGVVEVLPVIKAKGGPPPEVLPSPLKGTSSYPSAES